MQAKVIIIGGHAESLLRFRGDMIRSLLKNYEVVVSAPDAPWDVINALTAMGVVYEPLRLARTGLNILEDILTIKQIWSLLRKHKPKVAFFYTAKAVIYGSIAGRLFGLKRMYSMITGLGSAFIKEEKNWNVLKLALIFLYKLSLRYNSAIIFQNKDDLELLRNHKVLGNRPNYIVNGSGVDTDFYNTSNVVLEPVFICIARLLKDKGIYEYIAAARIVKSKYPDSRFLLAGWIDDKPSSVKKEDLQLWIDEGIIQFLGKLDDVRNSLSQANIFVLPSYREGTPRSVLEAMAMGKAIITTDAPGCRETVVNGENGFLVPVKDIEQLARSMEILIENNNLAREMGEKSRYIAVNKFNVHTVNRKLFEIMELKYE